jgi:hypothetical protein
MAKTAELGGIMGLKRRNKRHHNNTPICFAHLSGCSTNHLGLGLGLAVETVKGFRGYRGLGGGLGGLVARRAVGEEGVEGDGGVGNSKGRAGLSSIT